MYTSKFWYIKDTPYNFVFVSIHSSFFYALYEVVSIIKDCIISTCIYEYDKLSTPFILL